MKRSKAYDPPEYHDWQASQAGMDHFFKGLEKHQSELKSIDEATLLGLYRGLLRARLHDIALKRWVRTGVITKAWLGTGEEAVSIGSAYALKKGDSVGPMIRNAGAALQMGLPAKDMFGHYLAVGDTISKGRDLHAGDLKHGVITTISHVGSLVAVCLGAAMTYQMKKQDYVSLTYVGDGTTRTGEFHEAVNMAAVKKAPLIVITQNNGVALGTHYDTHCQVPLIKMAKGYGMTGFSCDGNNVLDVYFTTQKAVELCRRGEGPVQIEATTFRMGGHATHDEAEARHLFDQQTFDAWGQRDPIGCYEEWLLSKTNLALPQLESIEDEEHQLMDQAAAEALQDRDQRMPRADHVSLGIYAS